MILVAAFFSLFTGCNGVAPGAGAKPLNGTTCDLDIHWPLRNFEKPVPRFDEPLLTGHLALAAQGQADGTSVLRAAVVLTRPAQETDRQRWNEALAYSDVDWMEEVRVWDADKQWLWPNLAYLMRLPGKERVERYGGLDPVKRVDNDFAAVLIRKYDADGQTEAADTQTAPLVSAEWHAVGAAKADGHTIVHQAKSDEFQLHVGSATAPARGQIKVWLIYADFFGYRPPREWPKTREFAGGILAYFEIDWQTSPGQACSGTVRRKKPSAATGFAWQEWVVRKLDADHSEAKVKLSDRAELPKP